MAAGGGGGGGGLHHDYKEQTYPAGAITESNVYTVLTVPVQKEFVPLVNLLPLDFKSTFLTAVRKKDLDP